MSIYTVKPIETVTPDDLSDMTNATTNTLRKSATGQALLEVNERKIATVQEISGSLWAFDKDGNNLGRIVAPDTELSKPEWNTTDADANEDGVISEEEGITWAQRIGRTWSDIKSWFGW